MNVLPFCSKIAALYSTAARMCGYSMPWYSDLDMKSVNGQFINYIISQTEIPEIVKEESEKWNVIVRESEEIEKQLEEKTKLSWSVSCNTNMYRVLNVHIPKRNDIDTRLYTAYKPITDTLELFSILLSTYKEVRRDNPALLGNNWRLRKIFHEYKATKATTLNPRYVLAPHVVNEIANNYFLLVKFGWDRQT